MTTEFKNGDRISLDTSFEKGKVYYTDDGANIVLGEDLSPIFVGIRSVEHTHMSPGGTQLVKTTGGHWYAAKWLKDVDAPPLVTLEDKIDGLIKDMAIVKELLGVVEDDN